MSEVLYNGPLDVVRRINREAAELDELAAEYSDVNTPEYCELYQIVTDFDEINPLMEHQRQHEVTVYGRALTASIDEEGTVRPLALSREEKSTPVRGVYYGLTIRPTYDPETNKVANKVVHMIRTGHEMHLDEFYNSHSTTYFSHVCVEGSEIVPTLPIHAHSLEDLRRDDAVNEFDRLAFDELQIGPDLVRNLGAFANRVFARERSYELNHQRVSYLNSLGLLDDVCLITREFAIAERESYLANKDILYSDENKPVMVGPTLLDVVPGYSRLANGKIVYGGPPEVFATAEMEDGKIFMMPLKDAVDIRSMKSVMAGA